MGMSIDELKAAWNAQADKYNQWDELGLDEIVAFAQYQEREACAKVCDELPTPDAVMFFSTYEIATTDCAEAIRARSK